MRVSMQGAAMYACEICDREFKNGAGLAGHNQLKHGSERSGQRLSMSVLERSSERSESGEKVQERLLEQIQEQLERLEEKERADSLIDQVRVEGHHHGMSDPECPGCIEVVSETLRAARQKGIDETVAYYEAIPGVKNLRQAYEEHPDRANNWSSGVIGALASGEPVITITDL